MTHRRGAALLGRLALAGCASSQRRADWAAPPPHVEAVYDVATRSCWLKAGDTTLPTTRRFINKRSLEKALSRRQVRVMVVADPSVPTWCPGKVVVKLRDAGYHPSGYASK